MSRFMLPPSSQAMRLFRKSDVSVADRSFPEVVKPLAKVKLLASNSQQAFSYDFNYDLDLSPTPPYTKTIVLPDLPLAGDWTLEVNKQSKFLKLTVSHGELKGGQLGQFVTLTGSLSWIEGGGKDVEHTLRRKTWYCSTAVPDQHLTSFFIKVAQDELEQEGTNSGGAFRPESHRRFRLSFSLTQNFPPAAPAASVSQQQQPAGSPSASLEIAKRISTLNHSCSPHDVRLQFPNVCEGGADLCVSAGLLSTSSPLLKDLLHVDPDVHIELPPAKRTRRSAGKTTETTPEVLNLPDDELEDSDTEVDAFVFKTRPPKPTGEAPDESSYRQITVSHTAYSTFHSLLLYLQSDYLRFGRLKSTFSAQDPHSAWLKTEHDHDPSLPVFVSPKSMYRLAHLLHLPTLEQKCLDVLPKRLHVASVAYELFSPAAMRYPELRRVVLGFVKSRWGEVQATEAWQEMLERHKRDEIPGAAMVLVELLQAVTGA
ncbi:hypothetical protein JCM8097_009431 [Rhodosporidiobolus ruineniae]